MEVGADQNDFMSVFEDLKREKGKTALVNAINDVIDNLKDEQVVGSHVKQGQIPEYYKQKHKAQTLFRVSLPKSWRLVYMIQRDENGENGAFILEIFSHKAYNKRFGYFKKK